MKQLRRPPKYCQGMIDRHGKPRWYFRRPGFPRRALPGLPWSPQFMAEYAAAMEGDKAEIGKKQTLPGSIAALIASYYRSAEYSGMADSTKRAVRNILERFRAEHGDKRVAHLEKRHIQKIMAEKAATPDAANRLLRLLRTLMAHAIDLGWRRDDPTAGVKKLRHRTEGFTTWEEEHIDAFLAHHGAGSRAHLAFSLLLYTGQRRGDVVRMGRHACAGGRPVHRATEDGAGSQHSHSPAPSRGSGRSAQGQPDFHHVGTRQADDPRRLHQLVPQDGGSRGRRSRQAAVAGWAFAAWASQGDLPQTRGSRMQRT